jgi:hypothetical protein
MVIPMGLLLIFNRIVTAQAVLLLKRTHANACDGEFYGMGLLLAQSSPRTTIISKPESVSS